MERFGKAGYGEDVPTMMYAGIFGATIVGVRCTPRVIVVLFLWCFYFLASIVALVMPSLVASLKKSDRTIPRPTKHRSHVPSLVSNFRKKFPSNNLHESAFFPTLSSCRPPKRFHHVPSRIKNLQELQHFLAGRKRFWKSLLISAGLGRVDF